MSSPHPAAPRRRALEPLTLEDLTQDLVWPRLLRAGSLALRPARLGLGLVLLICVVIVMALTRAIIGPERASGVALILEEGGISLASAGLAIIKLMPKEAAREIYALGVGLPGRLLIEQPLAVLISGPALLVLTAIFGGAISRSVATEASQGVSIGWPQALGFSAGRWRSMVGALLIPLGLCWLVAFGLHVGGWALLSLPGLNIIGGLLWPVMLLAGLVGAIALLALLAGHPLLVPSVAVEGTDAIDAVQHVYSFVFARPLRLAMYWLLLAVQLGLMVLLVGLVVFLTLKFVEAGTTAWSGEAGRRIVGGLRPVALSSDLAAAGEPRGTERIASGLAGLFTTVLIGIQAGFIVSYYFTASTLGYLAMRRVVDGQDMNEVYMPTLIPGTQSPVVATASGPGPGPAPGPSSAPRATTTPTSVSDTGPADET